MAGEKDDQEKTEEPSQYKIDEARKKGEVASSKEVNSLIILSATIMTLALSLVYTYEVFTDFYEFIATLNLQKTYSDDGLKRLVKASVGTMLKAIMPISVVAFCVGIISNIAQIGFLYAPEILTLKFDRVNPLNGFKKIFAKKALVEAAKGLFKFAIVLTISFIILKNDLPRFIGFLSTEMPESFAIGKIMIMKTVFSLISGLILVALGDFAWEKYAYKKKMMMSKQEAKEEFKEKEGNPEIRQKIRTIQREMANKRMMKEVPEADVIVTNPTHFSVALKYDPKKMTSPKVVAKGVDALALKIREIAKKADVPIIENVPLARSLYKTVEPGEYVPRDMYKAVAEVLAFVFKLKRKQQALSSGKVVKKNA